MSLWSILLPGQETGKSKPSASSAQAPAGVSQADALRQMVDGLTVLQEAERQYVAAGGSLASFKAYASERGRK